MCAGLSLNWLVVFLLLLFLVTVDVKLLAVLLPVAVDANVSIISGGDVIKWQAAAGWPLAGGERHGTLG